LVQDEKFLAKLAEKHRVVSIKAIVRAKIVGLLHLVTDHIFFVIDADNGRFRFNDIKRFDLHVDSLLLAKGDKG
jgi:hypothetical protein